MRKVYGDDCLSRSLNVEWFKCFQEEREALKDNERSDRPRNVVNEENAEIVREFIRKEPKSSLKYMEPELGISAVDLLYFDRKFGVHKGLCQICSTQKRPQNSTFKRHH